MQRPDYYGWVVGFVTIDPAILDDRVERANPSLPRRVLERRDTIARASHESRFGMVAASRNSNLPPFVSGNMEEEDGLVGSSCSSGTFCRRTRGGRFLNWAASCVFVCAVV
ncbi:type II toxin-antitoxin system HicB family antitoxin [Acetobacter estunensis]|uniref:type II toxin-antitoxin system HicB family antitoxin n=1 Tax=Acetobacter estunensis TaxID=104097 RepID=UPI0034A04F76